MDDTAGIHVEFREREARALLVAAALSRGLAKRDPEMWRAIVQEACAKLGAEFVGLRQWQADECVAGLRLWHALGLGDAESTR